MPAPIAPNPDAKPPASPLRETLTIALPVAAVMVSYSVSQFVDKAMVSRLPNGDEAVAALGNGGIVAFVPIAVVMSCITVINTYVSQHIGAGRPRDAAAYPWNGLWLTLITWALVFVPLALTAHHFMPWLSRAMSVGSELPGAGPISPGVERMQAEYGRILLLGAVVTLAARSMSQFFFGIHKGGVILIASVLGNVVNALFNYLLIYGEWGFPRLEVRGAAIATVIGQCVEFAIPFLVFLSPKIHAKYGTRFAWRPSMARMRDIFRLGWPQGLMFGSEMTCWAIFMVGILGSLSVADNAAGWIGLSYMHLSFMPAVGVSIAVTALVGRYMGARKPEEAERRAWVGMRIAMVYMGLCALAFVFFREPLVRLFVDVRWGPERVEAVVRIGERVMICAAVFQLFDAVGITMVGALRGAGDTRIPGIVTALASWPLLIGGGYLMLKAAPQWGSLGPWVAASVYIILFALFMLGRFLTGRWKHIRLVAPPSDPTAGADGSILTPAETAAETPAPAVSPA